MGKPDVEIRGRSMTAARVPEAACICGFRAPVSDPQPTCPECGDEMFVVGSDHDFTKGAKR